MAERQVIYQRQCTSRRSRALRPSAAACPHWRSVPYTPAAAALASRHVRRCDSGSNLRRVLKVDPARPSAEAPHMTKGNAVHVSCSCRREGMAQRSERLPAHPVGEPLHQGVCEDQPERRRAQHDAVGVQLQQDSQPQQQLRSQQPCTCRNARTSGGKSRHARILVCHAHAAKAVGSHQRRNWPPASPSTCTEPAPQLPPAASCA